MALKIKEEFKDKVIGYNGRSLPLGQRKDLNVLAEIAQKSQDKSLLMLFEQIPTTGELEKEKVDKIIDSVKEAKKR